MAVAKMTYLLLKKRSKHSASSQSIRPVARFNPGETAGFVTGRHPGNDPTTLLDVAASVMETAIKPCPLSAKLGSTWQ